MGLLADLLARDDVALPARLPCGARLRALAPAVWAIEAEVPGGQPLILSAGIHGDETAPIELLCTIVDALLRGDLQPRVPLLLAFGNLAAVRAARRYLDDDLNRLFANAAPPASREAPRAAQLKTALARFCAEYGSGTHLDLHSAIRDSQFACFAIAPLRPGCELGVAQSDLLAACGIEAVMLTHATAPTFSALSAREHACDAFTLELGRVRQLGAGEATEFSLAGACLRSLIAGAAPPPAAVRPAVFRVSREIIKRSDAFRLHLPPDAPNFTAFAAGALVASDGDEHWHALAGERIVFPNPAVKPGLRAGLLVIADDT